MQFKNIPLQHKKIV